MSSIRALTKARQKGATLWQALQLSNRIPTDSCKFSTEKIVGAQNSD